MSVSLFVCLSVNFALIEMLTHLKICIICVVHDLHQNVLLISQQPCIPQRLLLFQLYRGLSCIHSCKHLCCSIYLSHKNKAIKCFVFNTLKYYPTFLFFLFHSQRGFGQMEHISLTHQVLYFSYNALFMIILTIATKDVEIFLVTNDLLKPNDFIVE